MKSAKQFEQSLPVWTRPNSVTSNASSVVKEKRAKKLTAKTIIPALRTLRAHFGK